MYEKECVKDNLVSEKHGSITVHGEKTSSGLKAIFRYYKCKGNTYQEILVDGFQNPIRCKLPLEWKDKEPSEKCLWEAQ